MATRTRRRHADQTKTEDVLTTLQESAGNQATVRALARTPTAAATHVMTLDGWGSYAIAAFQLEGNTSVKVTFDAGQDTARFMQAATEGRPIKHVTISLNGHTITLTDVVLTSFQIADGTFVSVELNGATREFK
jgi:hypothetical protein